MIRHCDGTDPNLTRQIPVAEFDPAAMTLSPWNRTALAETRIINCQCGLTFDDVDREAIYPHEPIPPPLTDAQREEYLRLLDSMEASS